MAQHLITVTVRGGVYTYDQNGQITPHHHVKNNDTISWISPDGNITVTFPHGCMPTGSASHSANQGQPTPAAPLHGSFHSHCKYAVKVGGNPVDDPEIIFDDGLRGNGDAQFEVAVADLDKVTQSAQTALKGLVTVLQESAKTEAAAAGKPVFFPFGITSISVQVTVTPVTVSVSISGPNSATA